MFIVFALVYIFIWFILVVMFSRFFIISRNSCANCEKNIKNKCEESEVDITENKDICTSDDKQEYFYKVINSPLMIGRPSVCRYKMEMINSYITKYGLLNFDRFYYVYCKEFGNALSKIEPHPSYTFKKDKTDMLESVYIKIFSNMLSDVEKEVSETLSLDTDMEAVKTYAKMSGDLFQ